MQGRKGSKHEHVAENSQTRASASACLGLTAKKWNTPPLPAVAIVYYGTGKKVTDLHLPSYRQLIYQSLLTYEIKTVINNEVRTGKYILFSLRNGDKITTEKTYKE